MISSVRGTAVHVDADAVVVEVGGVGLHVAVTPQVARTTHLGDTVTLHTSLIVREDALSLFGFESREELVVFGQLLGVTGVGPKSALGVLATLTVPQIADAVSADDDAPFRRVSGIGPKTAKLIVVQLAGKIAVTRPAGSAGTDATASAAIPAQVVQALVGLGWSERVAVEAVENVAADASESDRSSVPALLRLTLATLGPARKETVSG
ncbi:Holliday junction branch migration protein RuvA [Microbacterium trichothecenolyticum]|uniref:Holliday junction branch migration complex subunit RuvA n=1 Tax=Microbacterium ureisolvens TaxID=2781186 RepID=A0ABS7HVM6_9MICO|nr:MULTISPECIES: Holliday junction branch migration protein RuvA [Microbacterium]MBW9108615.1 Holliday junction branch migration protein RuvA [Microbacterium ureisolvens]MBW9118974.1 Holliday junction branch migration protein RuvA [Microbacterium trichothecenolyticum]